MTGGQTADTNTRSRSRAENTTLVAFAVLAFAGLAAAGLFDYSLKVTAASIALGACVGAYTVIGDRFVRMTKRRRIVAGIVAVLMVAGAALFWPARPPPRRPSCRCRRRPTGSRSSGIRPPT